MSSNGIKIASFQKITENHPAAGDSAPRPQSAIRLRYTSLLNTSPIYAFALFVTDLSPPPIANPG